MGSGLALPHFGDCGQISCGNARPDPDTTVENYFSIFKRGVTGNYQWVSAKHLKRYLGEFDFRYNTRNVTDFERAALAAKGIQGERLTYRRTGGGEARH